MDRRKALTALGASVAGFAVLAGGEARAADDHKHDEHFDKCAKACASCQLACDSCFHHCLELLASGKKEHKATVHTCVDCADACKHAATLVARHSPMAKHACECCAKCCDDCAAACEKFPDDKHMAACAKECRDCAKACREMIKHLDH
jgi:hypothetical protein